MVRVPHLNRLQRLFQGRGLVVVGVANEHPPRMKQFIEERRVEFPVVLDAKAFRNYGVRAIPGAVLVGPDGKVRFRGHPDQLTEEIIGRWLARNGRGTVDSSGQ